jgi:TRAP-type C4-dicarboxylate transport system substrate-binding protein
VADHAEQGDQTRCSAVTSFGSAVAAPAVLRIGRAQATERLKLHHMSPTVSNMHTHVLAPWAEKVEKDSDGELRIRIYPSMQLGGTPVQEL